MIWNTGALCSYSTSVHATMSVAEMVKTPYTSDCRHRANNAAFPAAPSATSSVEIEILGPWRQTWTHQGQEQSGVIMGWEGGYGSRPRCENAVEVLGGVTAALEPTLLFAHRPLLATSSLCPEPIPQHGARLPSRRCVIRFLTCSRRAPYNMTAGSRLERRNGRRSSLERIERWI